jgi:hypothetical protein
MVASRVHAYHFGSRLTFLSLSPYVMSFLEKQTFFVSIMEASNIVALDSR